MVVDDSGRRMQLVGAQVANALTVVRRSIANYEELFCIIDVSFPLVHGRPCRDPPQEDLEV